MNSVTHKFPAQQLPMSSKGKKWRKECVDFACDHTFLTNSCESTEKSVLPVYSATILSVNKSKRKREERDAVLALSLFTGS